MMQSSIIDALYEIGSIQFGDFMLRSGIQSPIYIDLRLLVSYPSLLEQVRDALLTKARQLDYDLICGVPYTGLPIATVCSIQDRTPMIMKRKEIKNHGTKNMIEGVYTKGQTCLIIEDLITSGVSILETIKPLENAHLQVKDILIIIDREQGGVMRLKEKGWNVHTLFTMTQILDHLENQEKIQPIMRRRVKEFIIKNQVACDVNPK